MGWCSWALAFQFLFSRGSELSHNSQTRRILFYIHFAKKVFYSFNETVIVKLVQTPGGAFAKLYFTYSFLSEHLEDRDCGLSLFFKYISQHSLACCES